MSTHRAITQLGALADKHGLRLELGVGNELLGPEGREYRNLGLLVVRDGKRILAQADAGLLTAQMAASACMTQLKAHL